MAIVRRRGLNPGDFSLNDAPPKADLEEINFKPGLAMLSFLLWMFNRIEFNFSVSNSDYCYPVSKNPMQFQASLWRDRREGYNKIVNKRGVTAPGGRSPPDLANLNRGLPQISELFALLRHFSNRIIWQLRDPLTAQYRGDRYRSTLFRSSFIIQSL